MYKRQSVGRVRVMRDDQGALLKEAGPSMPVEITGLTEVPAAGDLFDAVEDEKLARELAEMCIRDRAYPDGVGLRLPLERIALVLYFLGAEGAAV